MPYRDPWPNKADSPIDRARAVAREYRNAVARLHPELCRIMDQKASEVGQDWVLPVEVSQFEGLDLLTPLQAAMFCKIRPGTLPTWRHRGLKFVETPDGIRYRVEDLLNFQADQRLRRKRGQQSAGRPLR